jgi:hypothetical protein
VKTCKKCLISKNETKFSRNASRPDGLARWCRDCRRKYRQTPAQRQYNQEYQRSYEKTPAQRERDLEYSRSPAVRESMREYKKTDAWRKYMRDYVFLRCQKNPDFRLRKTLRSRLRNVMETGAKAGSAVRDLGCTVSALRERLEARFYPHPVTGEAMTWENYGHRTWHVDHIKPLAKFDLTDGEQFLQACHYTNLQPLWAIHNLAKGDR